ncbi:MAG: RagB/SusD family nutrient uptake outer membrane protein [Bacteroidales bacterium]|nr:RagB/SusD family nutrient uptake outer membrane protein [Bacteroidales bacterium]
MKKTYIILVFTLAVVGIIGSCRQSFLDIKPAGGLDQSLLANEKGIEALLIGAYGMLDGFDVSNREWGNSGSGWVYGSVRGLEANKGSNSGDQPWINPIQTYSETATNDYFDQRWRALYEAISRCNNLIVVVGKALESETITQAQADLWIQQARVLRGWYHFDAWRMWEMIPYLDETTDPKTVTNTEDVRAKIIADLTEGTNLPINMVAIGKFNRTVSQVLLAKAMMQMNKDYAGALTLLNDARANGKKPDNTAIGLAPTYGEVFDIVNRNGIEAIYTVQYSVNDGSGGVNGGYGEVLNFPYGSGKPGGCCGFFQPTQEFVNSFRTAAGLPLLDFSYNSGANQVKNDQGIAADEPFTPDTGPLDPRLDWAVGRRGIPYWDWGKVTGMDWIRDQTYGGPFNPKKQVYKKSQEGTYTEVGNWTSGWTANGYRMIRYADLLLLIAECQIETNDLAGARTNINLVRARAANPAGFVMDGAVPAANYVINTYPATGYPFDTQANARLALRMERKLELGQEGHRYFDLNRWGITVAELTRILNYEKTMPWGSNLYGDATVGPEDVTYPLPQRQIDLSNGALRQNTGH